MTLIIIINADRAHGQDPRHMMHAHKTEDGPVSFHKLVLEIRPYPRGPHGGENDVLTADSGREAFLVRQGADDDLDTHLRLS